MCVCVWWKETSRKDIVTTVMSRGTQRVLRITNKLVTGQSNPRISFQDWNRTSFNPAKVKWFSQGCVTRQWGKKNVGHHSDF